jgi:hypothetical protein
MKRDSRDAGMMRWACRALLAGGMVAVTVVPAMAVDYALPGTRLRLLQVGSTVRLQYVAKGVISMPAADPRTVGASIQIYNPSTGEDSGRVRCPASAWMVNADGTVLKCRVGVIDVPPCDRLQVVKLSRGRGVKVRARCTGAFSLDEPRQGTLVVGLAVGGDRYWSHFDRSVTVDQPGEFLAHGAPPPAGPCLLPPLPFEPRLVRFTSGPASGTCGATEDASGAVVEQLECGGLYFGGGYSSLALPTRLPEQAFGYARTACVDGVCTVGAATPDDVLRPVCDPMRHCTAQGCLVGPPVPLANAGSSKCGINRAASDITGTLDAETGAMSLALPIASEIYLTANATRPCPLCVGGTLHACGSGTCEGGPREGLACTPDGLVDGGVATSHDCPPPSELLVGTVTGFLGPLPALETASVSRETCPSAGSGAFGDERATMIRAAGSPAGSLMDGAARPLVAVSVFCVPPSEGALGFLVNGAADLPGPGAVAVAGTVQLLE